MSAFRRVVMPHWAFLHARRCNSTQAQRVSYLIFHRTATCSFALFFLPSNCVIFLSLNSATLLYSLMPLRLCQTSRILDEEQPKLRFMRHSLLSSLVQTHSSSRGQAARTGFLCSCIYSQLGFVSMFNTKEDQNQVTREPRYKENLESERQHKNLATQKTQVLQIPTF